MKIEYSPNAYFALCFAYICLAILGFYIIALHFFF